MRSQEVGYPQRVEEVASSNFFFTVIFAKIDEFEDVGMPWFEVYSERARALVAALIDVASGGVKSAKHGHNAIRVSISARNICTDDARQHDDRLKRSATNPVARTLWICNPMPPADLLIIAHCLSVS